MLGRKKLMLDRNILTLNPFHVDRKFRFSLDPNVALNKGKHHFGDKTTATHFCEKSQNCFKKAKKM